MPEIKKETYYIYGDKVTKRQYKKYIKQQELIEKLAGIKE